MCFYANRCVTRQTTKTNIIIDENAIVLSGALYQGGYDPANPKGLRTLSLDLQNADVEMTTNMYGAPIVDVDCGGVEGPRDYYVTFYDAGAVPGKSAVVRFCDARG